MENQETTAAGFNEDAALAELERLRQEIIRYRTQRKQLIQEFDDFVGSFKAPGQPRTPPPRARVEPRRQEPPDPVTARPDDEAAAPMPPASALEPAPPPAAVPARRVRVKSPALMAGALAVLAAGGWVTWMAWPRTPRTAAALPVPETTPALPDQPPAPAAEAAAPSPEPVSELTTTGPVWVRVIADGERVVERELPANARIPLTARKTIVIRAGNAAAVRVTLAGQDQGVLGPEGVALTRTFNLAPRPDETRDR